MLEAFTQIWERIRNCKRKVLGVDLASSKDETVLTLMDAGVVSASTALQKIAGQRREQELLDATIVQRGEQELLDAATARNTSNYLFFVTAEERWTEYGNDRGLNDARARLRAAIRELMYTPPTYRTQADFALVGRSVLAVRTAMEQVLQIEPHDRSERDRIIRQVCEVIGTSGPINEASIDDILHRSVARTRERVAASSESRRRGGEDLSDLNFLLRQIANQTETEVAQEKTVQPANDPFIPTNPLPERGQRVLNFD